MIPEEKIVRYTILASIFYGLFNLIGTFGSFLTPFIFDYAVVSVIALYFCYKNRKEEVIWPFYILTLAFIGTSIASGQFFYLVNLFAHKDKVDLDIPEWFYAVSQISLWFAIGVQIIQALKHKSDKTVKNALLLLTVFLIAFVVLRVMNHQLGLFFEIMLFTAFYLMVYLPKFSYSKSYYLSALILILLASLETLRIISILYV